MVNQEICPAVTTLRDLIEGRLEGAEDAKVAGHIDNCGKCQQAVEQLAPAREEILPLSVKGVELQSEAREQALKQAMERLEADGRPEGESECNAMSDDDSRRILSPSDRPGSLGRLGLYEITDVIGRGGMGIVFKAIDTTLDRIVAVKVLSSSLALNGTARKRFVREARSAAAVIHDHVITIHAVDEVGGQPYLVMQYVSGQSLQEKIDRGGPLEVKEILRISRQIASGLAAAHEQGLVHRDIKPSNLLLENGVERVKITDFGLARAVDDASITRNEVIAGTPQYMAPEQAKGEAVDHRADLFSLGSVLYTMCTGRPPFRAESTMATLRFVSDHSPSPIREINADIPQWLVEIIERLHEKEPAKRYQSAAGVERVLAERLACLQQPIPPSISSDMAEDATVEVTRKQPMKQARKGLKLGLTAALSLLLVALVGAEATGVTNITQLIATVFRIETPRGTVVVEVDDPNATVTLDGDEIIVGADGFKELRLKPGSYEFGTIRDGVPGKPRRVTVTQGSREIVRIGFENPRTEAEKCKPVASHQAQKARERVEILRQRVKVIEKQYHVGNVTFDRLLRASNDQLEAELQLASSPEERIKIIEEQLANLQGLEAVTTQLYKAGKCGFEDTLAAKADRMEVENRLSHERSSRVATVAPRPGELRLVGTAGYDEAQLVNIYTRLSARIERVYVDQTGVEVKKGDALVELYSAALYSAQEEFLQARKFQRHPPLQEVPGSDLLAVAREKLSLFGLTKDQIAELEKQGKAAGRLTLHAPKDGIITRKHAEEGARVESGARLFTIADPTRLRIALYANEAEFRWLRIDQEVTLSAVALPAETFVGRIAFISPQIDPKTRNVEIRVEFLNLSRKLKAGMTVHGVVKLAKE